MIAKIEKIIKGDKIIIIVVVCLMIISALMMASTLTPMSINKNSFDFGFLIRQLFFSVIAFLIMVLLSNVPYQIFSKLAKNLFIISIVLLALTYIFGDNKNEAKRWLEIPFLGISFQTSDIVRVAFVFYIAKILSEFNVQKDDENKLVQKIIIVSAITVVAVVFSNLSTSIIIFGTFIIFLFLAPISSKLFLKVLGISVAVGLLFLFIMIFFKIGRGGTWGNRGVEDQYEQKYGQAVQAKIAIANGSFMIQPGDSKQKYIIPNAESDFVFAIFVEEYGVIGTIILLGLYMILLFRAIKIIKRQERSFPLFLVVGLTMNFFVQFIIHILVNVGIFPVTGQPLPLISYGGTSIIVTAAQIGIILNISKIGTSEQKIPIIPTEQKEYDIFEELEEESEIKYDNEKPDKDLEIEDYSFIVN